jgi:hypothetical protein
VPALYDATVSRNCHVPLMVATLTLPQSASTAVAPATVTTVTNPSAASDRAL